VGTDHINFRATLTTHANAPRPNVVHAAGFVQRHRNTATVATAIIPRPVHKKRADGGDDMVDLSCLEQASSVAC